MTKEEILKKIEDSKSLSSVQGIADAIGKLLAAKSKTGGGGGQPPMPFGQQDMKVDPDVPELSQSSNSSRDDVEINDPDDLLKQQIKIGLEQDEQELEQENSDDGSEGSDSSDNSGGKNSSSSAENSANDGDTGNNEDGDGETDSQANGEADGDSDGDDSDGNVPQENNTQSSSSSSSNSSDSGADDQQQKANSNGSQEKDGKHGNTIDDLTFEDEQKDSSSEEAHGSSSSSSEEGDSEESSSIDSSSSSTDTDSEHEAEEDDTPESLSAEEKQLGRRQKEQVSRTKDLAKKIINKANSQESNISEENLNKIKKDLEQLEDIKESDLYNKSKKDNIQKLIDKTIEDISKVAKIRRSPDLEDRGKMVAKQNASAMANIGIDMEDRTRVQAEKQPFKKSNASATIYEVASTEQIKLELERLIKLQIQKYQEQIRKYGTYDIEDDELGIVQKHTVKFEKNKYNKPVLDIYLDNSGSFSDYRQLADQLVSNLLYYTKPNPKNKVNGKPQPLLDINIWHFTDHLSKTPCNNSCNGASSAIYRQIKEDKASNVILITDRDENSNIEAVLRSNPKLTLDGAVMFVWKTRGELGSSPKWVEALQGKLLTKEFYLE